MPHQANYEVVERRGDRLVVRVFLETEKRPIQQTMNVNKANRHRDGVEAYIEEKVQALAARRAKTQMVSDEEIPESGSVEYEPAEDPDRPHREQP